MLFDPSHLDDVAAASAEYGVQAHFPHLTGDARRVAYFRLVYLVKTAVLAYLEFHPKQPIEPSVN